jgi:hypothetical protein
MQHRRALLVIQESERRCAAGSVNQLWHGNDSN